MVGLNTPEMLEHDEAFVREHLAAMVAIMSARLHPEDPEQLVSVRTSTTERYSVTSSPSMATQAILRATPALPLVQED